MKALIFKNGCIDLRINTDELYDIRDNGERFETVVLQAVGKEPTGSRISLRDVGSASRPEGENVYDLTLGLSEYAELYKSLGVVKTYDGKKGHNVSIRL